MSLIIIRDYQGNPLLAFDEDHLRKMVVSHFSPHACTVRVDRISFQVNLPLKDFLKEVSEYDL
jgi:hypothetical protein